MRSDAEWREGWRLVLGASLGLATSYGLLMMTAGLFIQPLQTEFGLSRTAVTVIPMISLISAALMPATGWAIDRFGPRPIGLGGMLVLAISYAAFSFLPASAVILYLIVFVIGLVTAAVSPMSWTQGVSAHFVRSRGTALALTMSCTSVLSAVAVPLLLFVIVEYGWRAGYMVLSGALALVGFPSAWLLFRPPAVRTRPEVRDGTFAMVMQDPRAWLLLLCFSSVSFAVGGFMIHLVPLVGSKGLPPSTAALAGSAFALSIAAGRIGTGIMLDRLRPPLVAFACFILPILGTYLALVMSSEQQYFVLTAVAAAALIGFAQGAEADFIAFFCARHFPLSIYARVYAFIFVGCALTSAAGGAFFSTVYDMNGNYDLAIQISALCYLVGAVLILRIDSIGSKTVKNTA